MFTDFLLKVFEEAPENPAIIWNGVVYDYRWLSDRVQKWDSQLVADGVTKGSVVSVAADFSPNAIALFLSMVGQGVVVVPILSSSSKQVRERMISIAEVEKSYTVNSNDEVVFENGNGSLAHHQLIDQLRQRAVPGLILFSSGSSGHPKAAVHDFSKLLKKFHHRRANLRILNFLLFDHWGGLNTMLHTLSNGGTVLTCQDRAPERICEAIERYKIEVLPASPSFLNLLLLSRAYKRYDLSSLKVISYGTEPMPQTTLKRMNELFPDVKLQQTYGLIELGVLRSKSRSSDSLWVKVGGDGFETRIVDGLLQIKAESAMLGYLNAPSPFTEDGWFMTGDAVEVDGEYLKILGRKSELINVGGEKVYPQEVENFIQQLDNIADVTVYGEKNPILGNVVCAKIRLEQEEDRGGASVRIKRACREGLQSFKVPVKIEFVDVAAHNDRFKKVRYTAST